MTLQYISCAQNDNKGEQITRNFLMSSLAQSSSTLLGNYHLPVRNSTRECDLVLFNQRGIWILEVKNWRGSIVIDQVNWQRDDGLIQHSPLISVEIKAKILASVLEHAGFRNISIVGLVVLAQSNAQLQNSDNVTLREPREDKIFRLDSRLIRALTGRNYLYEETNKELSTGLIQKIVSTLLPRAIDPEQERIGDSYRILYDLGPGPDEIFHAYQAVHLHIPGWYARAKKYYTPSAFSTGELTDALSRFQRDMQALVRIGKHPNIVQVYDYQPDRDSSDIHWLLLEWIKGISLQDRLETGPKIPFQEQLHILFGMLDALDCCHSRGILHRNITPACIYLANDGTVKLGDFDFARVPDLPLTLTFTDRPFPLKAHRYMAPELRTNAREADVGSDLYALGAIWYDMMIRPEPGEKIDLSRLEETGLPLDARDLLVRLLAPDAKDRPRNAKAVKRWLEQV
jgi:serine/threonine protein kinase